MSLKRKFLFFVIIPAVVIFSVTTIILTNRVKKYEYKYTKEKTNKTSDLFSLYIYDKLAADIDILKTLEVSLGKNENSPETYKKISFEILKNVLIQNHDYKSVWFVRKNNDSRTNAELFKIYKKNQELITENRKLEDNEIYYNTLLAKTETSEKDLFISNYNKQKNIITISVPYRINFLPSGICSIDIDISETLNEFNKKYASEDISSFFILSEDDDFISDTENEILKNDFIRNFDLNKADFNITKKVNLKFYSEDELYFASVKQISFKSGNTKWITVTINKFDNGGKLLKALNSEIIILMFILLLALILAYTLFFVKHFYRIKDTGFVISAVAFGRIKDIKRLDTSGNDEIADINNSVNVLNENLDKTANYIEQIYNGNINFDYKPVSKDDKIGNLTLKLAKSIKKTKEEEEKRKIEDEIQNWITKGSALFAEIIRDYSDNLEELSYAIISKLVNYIEADQGGIFVINEDENNEKYIELLASYAYDRRKMLEKKIPWGAGLVGRCILERETIFMTKIPDNYLNITSGLGKEKPQTLLIVPLIFHEEVYGVAELASFKYLDEYKIKLVEQVSQSIASAISMVKINARTAELLRETKIKSEQSASQEEEIRQNIEEMQAVTDGLNHKLAEAENTLNAIKNSVYFVEFDTKGRITDISENYLKILKKNKADIIGRLQGSFSSKAQDPETFKKFWDDLMKGNVKEFTQTIKTEDGEIEIKSTYYPVKNADGNIFKVISTANIK